MSEKPLTPLVVAERSGKILGLHCDCVTGLGETCSHVGSLLFAIESGVRIRDSMTATQKKAYWVMPTGAKEHQYAPVKDVDLKKGSAAIRRSPLTAQPTSSQVSASSTVVSCGISTVVSSANSFPSQLPSPTFVKTQILPCSRSGTPVPVILCGHQSHQRQFAKKH